MPNIVQINNHKVKPNVQLCANWPDAIKEGEVALKDTLARLRRSQRKISAVRAKVQAKEPFPVSLPDWSWSRALREMEATMPRLRRHVKYLKEGDPAG